MIQVGQTIYGNHSNNNRARDRVGTRSYMGLPTGWQPYKITGETKQSWICGQLKIDKKTMLERNKDFTPVRFVATLEEVKQEEFISNNYKLAELVRRCKDYDKLKRIEAILQEGV